MVSHNELNEYTHMNEAGGSGSGKSTILKPILQEMSDRHHYKVYYFDRDALFNISKIVRSLEHGQDCILVFDNISYLLVHMSIKDFKTITQQLATIKDIIHARVISVFVMHSSFMYRHADFGLITSITEDEKERLSKITGYHNRIILNDFYRRSWRAIRRHSRVPVVLTYMAGKMRYMKRV